jgi:putative transposon-encoded protein
MEIRMEGYEVVEKVVTQHATSAKILVPKHWIGKKVRAVRLERLDTGNEERED